MYLTASLQQANLSVVMTDLQQLRVWVIEHPSHTTKQDVACYLLVLLALAPSSVSVRACMCVRVCV